MHSCGSEWIFILLQIIYLITVCPYFWNNVQNWAFLKRSKSHKSSKMFNWLIIILLISLYGKCMGSCVMLEIWELFLTEENALLNDYFSEALRLGVSQSGCSCRCWCGGELEAPVNCGCCHQRLIWCFPWYRPCDVIKQLCIMITSAQNPFMCQDQKKSVETKNRLQPNMCWRLQSSVECR